MGSTYSQDPGTSDKDAVRFLIADTGPSFRMTDEEIQWMIDSEGNLWCAAALACDKLTTMITSGGLSSKSVGGLSESYSTGSVEFYTTQAETFRSRCKAGQTLYTAEGQLVNHGKDGRIFRMYQFDNPRAPSGPGSSRE
jgi:hypothetical protein